MFVLQLKAVGGGRFMREVTKREDMLKSVHAEQECGAASLFLLHVPCISFRAVKAGGVGWELLQRLA